MPRRRITKDIDYRAGPALVLAFKAGSEVVVTRDQAAFLDKHNAAEPISKPAKQED